MSSRRQTPEEALLGAIFGTPTAPEKAQAIFRREAEARLRREGRMTEPGDPTRMPEVPIPSNIGDLGWEFPRWRYVAGESADDAWYSGIACDEEGRWSLDWVLSATPGRPQSVPGHSADAYAALARDRAEWVDTAARMARDRAREAASAQRHMSANRVEEYRLFHPFYESFEGDAELMTAREAAQRNRERKNLAVPENELVWTSMAGQAPD